MEETNTSGVEISSIIICVYDGTSFDPIFRKFNDDTKNKNNMVIYNISYKETDELVKLLKEQITTESIKLLQIKNSIESIDPSNVIFYYECCSDCEYFSPNNNKYNFPTKETIGHIVFLIKEKNFMVICGDFSLKSLIGEWDESSLGKNPFTIVGSTCGSMTLLFDKGTLINSSSEQLKLVGTLSETDSMIVDSLPSTIVYNVVDLSEEILPYILEVLTVVDDKKNKYPHCRTIDGKYEGTAGHCILKYSNGGILMTSNCHFIELLKIDTSIETVVSQARGMYGEVYSQRIEEELRSAPTESMRTDSMNNYIVRMVSDTTPSMKPK